MVSKQEKRHELRHRAIIDAASEIFAEQGIHTATLEQIGIQVGLSKTSLYYYVKNKEQIIADVLKAVLEQINARAEALTDINASALDQLKARARAHVEAGTTIAGKFIVMNLDYLRNNKQTAQMMRQQEEPARRLLKQAIDAGEIRQIDIVSAVKMLYGALNNIYYWHKPEYGTLDDVLENTWDIFVGGLRNPSNNP